VFQFAASPLFDIVLLGTLVSARAVFKIRTHRLVCGVLCAKELVYLLGNLLQRPMGGHGDSLGVIVLIAYLLLLFVGGAFDSFRSSSSPSIPEELSVAMSRKYALTPREVDVLRYLLQGSTYDRIGKQLFIAASTVKTHVNHIYAKMGVESRDEFIDLMNAGPTAEQAELAPARKA
jgi:DNA-binding CsgD family transcriptional regulator